MEQLNLEQKDLAGFLGSKSRVSEILNRKRRLTLPMIRKLHQKLNIPYESLMNVYETSEGCEQV
jgi:HTH-type transcriptional regulator/antitoxin HigA